MSLTLNPQKVHKPIPQYLSQARGINRAHRYEEPSYKWDVDVIGRAEDRRRRLDKSLSCSIHFASKAQRLSLQLDTASLVFQSSAALLHNAVPIFWALISLPVGSPLLAASTGYKLDLYLAGTCSLPKYHMTGVVLRSLIQDLVIGND